MKSSKEKALHNCEVLEGSPEEFTTPWFTTKYVRWFSFGSCNGNVNALMNVDASVESNPLNNHAIWCEPRYWNMMNNIINPHRNLKLVYSNKILDSVVYKPGFVSFNLASHEITAAELHREHPDAISCFGKCVECGWRCYNLDDGVVIEIVNNLHGNPNAAI
jgi:hypothetical protein